MAFRKNKKFIDPRYFMDEKMETIKEEAEATLDEYMKPVNRPADQKKPWGGRTSHQDKPLRWGGHDIPAEPSRAEPEEDEDTIKEWESQHAAMQRYADRADQPQAAADPDPNYDFPTLWDRITDMIRNAPQMEQSNMLAKIQNDLGTLR